MRYLILRVEGMTCDACARNLEMILEAEPGVRMASVEFESGEARLLYDPRTVTEAQVIAATARLGYRVAAASP